MKFKISSYRTFSGRKNIVEVFKKKDTQWVIYENNKPKFFVDFFDLKTESNAMMNSLVLCGKRSLHEVLELINKKNNTNLSIPIISKLGIKKKLSCRVIELDLEPLPEEWLAYSF
jgi:hypothetical protein